MPDNMILTRKNSSGNTGRWRFRPNMFGQLVLQVERSVWDDDSPGMSRLVWIDATVRDINVTALTASGLDFNPEKEDGSRSDD